MRDAEDMPVEEEQMESSTLMKIMGVIVAFSLISIIYISAYLMTFGAINDFMIMPMYNLSVDLEAQGLIASEGLMNIERAGLFFQTIPTMIDPVFVLAFFTLIIGSLVYAYLVRPMNYFGAFSFLFYGVIFVLFMVSVFSTISVWWKDQVLLQVLPSALDSAPMFVFFMSNIGVISAVLVVACLIVNLMDFDFSNIFNRKKKEQQSARDNEVV